MALFNVTRHGVADPFEWAVRQHPKPSGHRAGPDAASTGGSGALQNSVELLGWDHDRENPARINVTTLPMMASPSQHHNTDGQSPTTLTSNSYRGASGRRRSSCGSSSRTTPRSTSPRAQLINATGSQRPRSTRSAAVRASQVTATEGLVLPPVPGAMPPVPTHVRGNTASAPKSLPRRPVHNGSHEKFLELRTKHRHLKNGPNDLYIPQMTTQNDYGRWLRTCMPQEEHWVLEPRRGIAASEVTKFVDEMAKTNKDFQLF